MSRSQRLALKRAYGGRVVLTFAILRGRRRGERRRSRGRETRRRYAASNVPTWHAECAPRRPRGVLYNRIPKSGSASIMSWMSGQLNLTAYHRFGKNVTDVTWWSPHIPKHRWLAEDDLANYVASLSEHRRPSGDFAPLVLALHLAFKRTAPPAVRRCKNQQRPRSHGRDWPAFAGTGDEAAS